MQYVPADLKAVYREQFVPIADILTPNQFELEYGISHIRYLGKYNENFRILSEMEIKTEQDALKVSTGCYSLPTPINRIF